MGRLARRLRWWNPAVSSSEPRKGTTVLRSWWLRPCVAVLLVTLLLLVPSVRGETPTYDPRSHIQRPPVKGPTYITASAGAGAVADGDQARPGYSFSVIFRPHRAADFFSGLYAWNTGLVLQVDKQGGGPASIISGDLILRRYLSDMRPVVGGRSFFLGMGVGISHAEWSNQPDAPDGSSDNFSFLVEGGLEWNFDPALVLMGKGQYRLYDRGGHNHSGWSIHLGFGLPFPF